MGSHRGDRHARILPHRAGLARVHSPSRQSGPVGANGHRAGSRTGTTRRRRGRRGTAMIVMKFGGTSVGIPEHFAVATRLVAERVPRDPVVVVSALAGVTNLLVEFCRSTTGRHE